MSLDLQNWIINFFRTWYLQGRACTEKKISLAPGTDKVRVPRHLFITIHYTGPSFLHDGKDAPVQTNVRTTNSNTKLNFGVPEDFGTDLATQFDEMIDETSAMFDKELNNASSEVGVKKVGVVGMY